MCERKKSKIQVTREERLERLRTVTDYLLQGVVEKDSRYDWVVNREQFTVMTLPIAISSNICTYLSELDWNNDGMLRELVRVRLINAHHEIIGLCQDTIDKLEQK